MNRRTLRLVSAVPRLHQIQLKDRLRNGLGEDVELHDQVVYAQGWLPMVATGGMFPCLL